MRLPGKGGVCGTRGGRESLRPHREMKRPPNHSIQRMGASPFGHLQFGYHWQLAPTADAERWADAPVQEAPMR